MNILILDENLTQVSLLSSYVSLNWNRQFASQGSFEINVNLNSLNAEELKVGLIVYLDSNRVGIIERIEVTRETDVGSEILSASGIEIKDIIGRRLTVPETDIEKDEYLAQTTETIIRSLLTKHITDPSDTSRKINIYELGVTNGVGNAKDFSTRYKPLDEEVYNLLQEDSLGLVCTVDMIEQKASFEVQGGLNRTIDQNTKPTALFSLKLGTANQNVVLHDAQAFKNMAYVGGEGEGLERTIVNLPVANIPNGIERREVFVDARDSATEDELQTRGNTKLAGLGKICQVDSVANNTKVITYSLGDLVTVIDYKTGDYENLQITGIIDTYAGSAPEQRSIVFGRAPMNIGQAINARLSGVNNILTQ